MVPMCIPEALASSNLGAVLLVGILLRMLVPVIMECVARCVAIFSSKNHRAERALRVLQVGKRGSEGSEPTSSEADS
jgi:hypothetical protein